MTAEPTPDQTPVTAKGVTPTIVPVILAGGSGTRLWPLSRTFHPKQFLALGGEDSLLQQTVKRAATCCETPPLLICNDAHRFLTAEQVRATDTARATIMLEPAARNTAPAIAVAAWQVVHSHGEDAVMCVMPADHLIADDALFAQGVTAALEAANSGALVTFGVKPDRPATGFGYIRAGGEPDASGAFPIEEFVEKPDRANAERYLSSGDYFWNAGIFVFRASRYLQVLETLEPAMFELSRKAVQGAERDLDFIRLDADAFSACRDESIDYAVMEKASQRVVVPFAGNWSDVGSWDAVFEAGSADANRNVTHGDTLMENCRDCYIHSESRLVATLGLANIGVVETSDSVFVTDLAQAQDARLLVARLKKSKRSEVDFHKVVHRPWGSYESLATGDRFQVKRLIVKPGARLSLQRHHHRSEHWIVAYGTALVTIDDDVRQLNENTSTYIPLGAKHRLENPGKIPLVIIEVQSGSYFGEDDIERFDDVYGRGAVGAQ